MKHVALTVTLAGLLALAACGEKDPSKAPAAPTPDTMAVAETAPPDPGKLKYGSICAGCHGAQGQGQASFPKLAGQTADEIAAKLNDYKAGRERGPQTAIMAPTAQGLSDEDIQSLATYISGLGG